MSGYDHEMIALLLIVLLGLALSIGTLFLFLVVRWVRQRNAANKYLDSEYTLPFFLARPGVRFSFVNQPFRWLAVKGNSPIAVQMALRLHRPTPCSWEEGLIDLGDRRLFISPPVSGWILVVGSGLPEPSEDVDDCFHFLTELSRKLGHIQYFSANRVLNHHAWALVDQGRIFRAYAWAGETLWNQGPVTAAEKELQMRCFEYAAERAGFEAKDPFVANSEKVHRLAARWSVDPTTIDERNFKANHGIAGEFSGRTHL